MEVLQTSALPLGYGAGERETNTLAGRAIWATISAIAALFSASNSACKEGDVQENVREARLRPEYADLYPGLQPGVWQPATAVGQQLLLWHLATAATPQGERLMADEHFEFRGGLIRGATNGTRTRASDQFPSMD
jgi:hypothetical protein